MGRLISGLFFYGLTTVLTTTGRNFVLLVVWADKCDDHYRQTPIKCSRSFPVRKILVSDDGQTSARSTPRRAEHAWIFLSFYRYQQVRPRPTAHPSQLRPDFLRRRSTDRTVVRGSSANTSDPCNIHNTGFESTTLETKSVLVLRDPYCPNTRT